MYSAKIQWSILFWNCRWIHFCIKSNFIQHLKNSSIKNTSSFSSIKYYMFLTICYLSWVLVWAGRGESSYCLAGRTGTRGQISGGHWTHALPCTQAKCTLSPGTFSEVFFMYFWLLKIILKLYCFIFISITALESSLHLTSNS